DICPATRSTSWSPAAPCIDSRAHASSSDRRMARVARSPRQSSRGSQTDSSCPLPLHGRSVTSVTPSLPRCRSAVVHVHSTIAYSPRVDKPPIRSDASRMADDETLAPSLLLAMPQLRDPNFTRTVVLLCEHGPDGAVGFVVNRPTDIRAANAVALDPPPKRDSG